MGGCSRFPPIVIAIAIVFNVASLYAIILVKQPYLFRADCFFQLASQLGLGRSEAEMPRCPFPYHMQKDLLHLLG